jgi:DNA polymerase-3 subunit delta
VITLLFGENSFDIDQYRRKIVSGFSGVPEKLDGYDLDKNSLLSIFMGQTLFSDTRLIIIDGLSVQPELWNELPEWVEKLSNDIHIVLVEGKVDKRTATYKWLQKNIKVIECKPWSPRDMQLAISWMADQVKAHNLDISHANIQLLVRRVGLDQWRLHQALEKLELIDEINEFAILEHIDAHPEENVYELFETALGGKSELVQEKIHTLKQTEDPYMVFGLLASQVLQFSALALSDDASSGTVAKDIGAHPFVLSKLAKYTRNVSKIEVRSLMQSASQADIDMKSGSDPWIVIERFLLEIATK